MTARDDLRVPLVLAWGLLGRPVAELDGLLNEYDAARRDEVLAEGADELDRIADETETRVAEHYGLAFGVGSAEMVRECARTIRNLAARTTTAPTSQES